MAKATDMKKLQQQVTKMRTQQQKRTDRVVELKTEVEKVTCIIQPVDEKVRQEVQSAGLTTSEHISSELVENLKKMEADVQEETERIVKIF